MRMEKNKNVSGVVKGFFFRVDYLLVSAMNQQSSKNQRVMELVRLFVFGLVLLKVFLKLHIYYK